MKGNESVAVARHFLTGGRLLASIGAELAESLGRTLRR